MIYLYKILRRVLHKYEELEDKYLNKFTKEFDDLVSKNKMNINTLENIMDNNIEEYEKLEFITITGKIIINRTILQIVDDIDLEQYNIKSKLIVPLDKYLRIDKLPFKISIRAMIEIAFWGQNQSSFVKDKEIIKRVNGIDLSYVTVMNVTEYIGKIVFDYNYNKALEIWNN